MPEVTSAYHTNMLTLATQIVFHNSSAVRRIARIRVSNGGDCRSNPRIRLSNGRNVALSHHDRDRSPIDGLNSLTFYEEPVNMTKDRLQVIVERYRYVFAA